MDGLHIEVSGEREAGLRFEEFPNVLYEDFRQEIQALGIELLARIQADTPSLTGELRSQERLRLFTDPQRITAYVDIDARKGSGAFAKAGALEYGAHRPTKVGAHSMKLDHFWAVQLAAPETVLVEAYTRTPDIHEFAFERGPLAAMRPEVVARLNAVVEKAVGEVNR